MSIRFEINAQALEHNHGMIQWYQKFAAQCLREAQLIASQKISGGTGAYERSFKFELIPGNPPKLQFGNTAPHAIFLEEGTKDHEIAPTPKGRASFTNPNHRGALRFFSPPGGGQGAAVFSAGHKVSGIKAMHIVRDAVSNAGDSLSK